MIRMNKNESPYRALTEVEIGQVAIDTHFNEYIEQEYEDLCELYADFNHLDSRNIAFANGSDEWIQRCMMVLPEGKVMTLEPDFVMYDIYAEQFKRKMTKVACENNYYFDYDKILKKIKEEKPVIFILSQPNNPLGTLHPNHFILKAAELIKEYNGYFVIDLAYIEFTEFSETYPTGDHVIYLRTLSKVYGLAGLRVGAVYSTEKTMEKLNSVSHPYPLNTFSINVARKILQQSERLSDFIDLNRNLATKLKELFTTEVGDIIPMVESHTNFLFTYGDDAVELGQWISDHGYKLRTYPESSAPSLEKAVRYSIAKEEDLENLRTIIQEWREKK